jgi:uncharacterized protein
MIHSLIGLVVGIIMGLTGAGGALISIPLFLNLLDASLKEATVLSLLAVILGTSVNLFGQKIKWDKQIVAYFVIFGAISNYASLTIKSITPDYVIALLLTAIAAYSVWGVWSKKGKECDASTKPSPVKMALTGLGLGVVTTLTGLGGGVLLVPILMKIFGKTYAQALPTSLATILLISSISFLLQLKTGLQLIHLSEFGLLAAGALSAFFLLKLILKRIEAEKVDKLRKIVFTLVTVYSISSVLIKSF